MNTVTGINTRIEVRDFDSHGIVLIDQTTDGVISIANRAPGSHPGFGRGPDGRTIIVLPSDKLRVIDVTINKPRDLIMVTVQKVGTR